MVKTPVNREMEKYRHQERHGGETWRRDTEERHGGETRRRGTEERHGGETWRRAIVFDKEMRFEQT